MIVQETQITLDIFAFFAWQEMRRAISNACPALFNQGHPLIDR